MSTVAPQLGTVLGLALGGYLGDAWSRRWRSGRFCVQLVGLVLAIPCLFTIGLVDSKTVILLALFAHGVGFWLYLSNLWTTTFEVVDPAARSTAVGLLNVTAGLLGSWPYLVVGMMRDKGWITDLRRVFLTFAIALCVAVGALAFLILRTLDRDVRGRDPS